MTGQVGIDQRRLGMFFLQLRKQFGYRNTEEFAAALAEKAGYNVSKDTVYRIESGRQEASVSYMCAVGMATFGTAFPYSFRDVLLASACDKWQATMRVNAYKAGKKAYQELIDAGITDVRLGDDGVIYETGGEHEGEPYFSDVLALSENQTFIEALGD